VLVSRRSGQLGICTKELGTMPSSNLRISVDTSIQERITPVGNGHRGLPLTRQTLERALELDAKFTSAAALGKPQRIDVPPGDVTSSCEFRLFEFGTPCRK